MNEHTSWVCLKGEDERRGVELDGLEYVTPNFIVLLVYKVQGRLAAESGTGSFSVIFSDSVRYRADIVDCNLLAGHSRTLRAMLELAGRCSLISLAHCAQDLARTRAT